MTNLLITLGLLAAIPAFFVGIRALYLPLPGGPPSEETRADVPQPHIGAKRRRARSSRAAR